MANFWCHVTEGAFASFGEELVSVHVCRMKRLLPLSLALAGIAALDGAEPRWLHPWQHALADWRQTLTVEDLSVEIRPIGPATLKTKDDLFATSQGYGHMLVSEVASVVAIPAEAFTWQQIWRADLPLEQAALKDAHHGLEAGQVWLPSHPTAANWLAWGYANERAWSTHRGNVNLARRAAVIAMVDLMMQAESEAPPA